MYIYIYYIYAQDWLLMGLAINDLQIAPKRHMDSLIIFDF